jgi:hypothetical protein
MAAIIRCYAAYNIENPAMYQLAMWSYFIAWGHFMAEWWYYKTTVWGMPLAGPVIGSTISLIWLPLQYGYYVK